MRAVSYVIKAIAQLENLRFEPSVPSKTTRQPNTGYITESAGAMTLHAGICSSIKQMTFSVRHLSVTCVVALHKYTNVKHRKSPDELLMPFRAFKSRLERNPGLKMKGYIVETEL